jgi:hypothetical protein
MVFVFAFQHPVVCFRNPACLCDRTLLTAVVFCSCASFLLLFVFLRFTSQSLSHRRDSNHLCEQLGAHEAEYALSFEERGRPSNQRTGIGKTAAWPTRFAGQVDSPLPFHSASLLPRRRNSA